VLKKTQKAIKMALVMDENPEKLKQLICYGGGIADDFLKVCSFNK
jgi:hypothetical protein